MKLLFGKTEITTTQENHAGWTNPEGQYIDGMGGTRHIVINY